jgi:hypothetical protein
MTYTLKLNGKAHTASPYRIQFDSKILNMNIVLTIDLKERWPLLKMYIFYW